MTDGGDDEKTSGGTPAALASFASQQIPIADAVAREPSVASSREHHEALRLSPIASRFVRKGEPP